MQKVSKKILVNATAYFLQGKKQLSGPDHFLIFCLPVPHLFRCRITTNLFPPSPWRLQPFIYLRPTRERQRRQRKLTWMQVDFLFPSLPATNLPRRNQDRRHALILSICLFFSPSLYLLFYVPFNSLIHHLQYPAQRHWVPLKMSPCTVRRLMESVHVS